MTNARLFAAGVCLLITQAVLTHGLARLEYLPAPPPFDLFPRSISGWTQAQDSPLEPNVHEMLSPDDVLNRIYWQPETNLAAQLFVAYYKSQHNARNAHDPKACLPGHGWTPKVSKLIDLRLGRDFAAKVNYYLVAKGDDQLVALYWYQTHKRVVAHEQILRFYRLIDTITDQRTDMALVRIVCPVVNRDVHGATEQAVDFASQIYPLVLRQFPPRNT